MVELFRLLRQRLPALKIVWLELEDLTAPFSKTGKQPTRGDADWAWNTYGSKIKDARTMLSDTVDFFINDTVLDRTPNRSHARELDYALWQTTYGLHACNPGPTMYHKLQLILHAAAFFNSSFNS